jgi:DNA-binding NarL/FixJ family response regulator
MTAAKRKIARNAISLMLVDDHPVWRDALRRILEHRRVGVVVAEASDGPDAIEMAASAKPDLVVMDINLPTMNGIEATRKLLERTPGCKVLVLSASELKADVLAAVQAGVSGYMLKTATPSDVADAVRRVHHGETVLPASIADVVMTEFRRLAGSGHPSNEPASGEARPQVQQAVGNIFRREGDYWTLGFGGRTVRLRDALGVRYLAELVRRSGIEVHVADLAASTSGGQARSKTAASTAARDGIRSVPGDAGDVLDAQARAEYKRRLEELRADIQEAEGWGDADRAARLQEEVAALSAQLASAYGLGGRPRKAADPTERIRKAVGNRIRVALARIQAEHPDLGRHLAGAVRTGTFCSYEPDSPTRWAL